MESIQSYFMDTPATYRIRVLGRLDSDWVDALWRMICSITQTDEGIETVIEGEVIDQAALLGIINTLYNTGHVVVSVERIADEGEK
jgi:hypothetical protein